MHARVLAYMYTTVVRVYVYMNKEFHVECFKIEIEHS